MKERLMPNSASFSTARLRCLNARRAALALAVMSSLALTACAVGPTYSPPPVTKTSQWNSPLPHDGDAKALAQWWAGWNDPALVTFIDAAQTNNPTLEQATARINQARATQGIVGSTVLPTVSGGANAQRGNSQAALGAATTFGASLQAAWELDLFGANRRGREAADARLSARTLDWHQARVSLAADVAATYVNLRISEALATGFERDAVSRSETARLTDLKTNAGFEAPANAALARAGAAEAHARLIAQRADVDLSVKQLVALTGLTERDVRDALTAAKASLPVSPALAIERLPASTLSQRPDLASLERELAALTADIGAAEADRYPRISLTGSVGYSLGRAMGATTDGATWGFGPSITLPIFDAGRRASNVAQVKARYDEALAGYKATASRAVREVEEALTQVHAARLRKPDLAASRAGYQSFEKAAQARLAAGAGSVLELEDARRAVLAAQVGLLALEREQLIATISLYRAVGGGYSLADAAIAPAR